MTTVTKTFDKGGNKKPLLETTNHLDEDTITKETTTSLTNEN